LQPRGKWHWEGDVMLEALKNWILTICTAVFFITAVEMILPDNSMKKYAKFVMGLILITVFLNPIIGLFNSNFNIAAYAENFSSNIEKEGYQNVLADYKNRNIEDTLNVFQENLKQECEKELTAKYPEDSFQVKVEAFYNEKKQSYEIRNISIGIKEGAVKKIEKIKPVGDTKSVSSLSPEENRKFAEVKTYIGSQLNLSAEIIEVSEL
jgi:stage III sporulation protein AF